MDQEFAHQLDSNYLQRVFNSNAEKFDDHAWLHREVGDRLIEHLEPITIDPNRLLDLGSATGDLSLALTQRYKSAQIYSLDFARNMLSRAHAKSPRWFSRQHFICNQAQKLSLADQCVKLVCSNLLFPWLDNPQQALAEIYRVLDTDGLLMLSSFGPQTLSELRQGFSQVDNYVHINAFMDMHDLGDVMGSVGFRDVVVDSERITVTYKSFQALIKDVQALGAGNANQGRSRGLMSRGNLANLERAYESHRQDGLFVLSFELVFAHGWKQGVTKGPIEVQWRDRS